MRQRTVGLMAAVAIGLCLASLSSCKTHRELAKTDGEQRTVLDTTSSKHDGHGRARHKEQLTDSVARINCRTFSANFSCVVDGMTASGQIRLMCDSVIWVSLSKVIEIGRAKFTPSHVSAYIKLINKSFNGDYALIAKRYGVDVDFATMQALLLGNALPGCVESSKAVQKGDTVVLYRKQQIGEGRDITMKKDAKTLTLNETTVTTAVLKEQLRCSYEERKEVDGRMVPTKMRVQLRSKRLNKTVVVKLDKVRFDQEQSYPFIMPGKK
ncbi:MAG: DUF4292 domain-containing protein [Bacteroidales bacterium]|nr:DUF4292 domain-containing protein [Bacteroidales bacterium]